MFAPGRLVVPPLRHRAFRLADVRAQHTSRHLPTPLPYHPRQVHALQMRAAAVVPALKNGVCPVCVETQHRQIRGDVRTEARGGPPSYRTALLTLAVKPVNPGRFEWRRA